MVTQEEYNTLQREKDTLQSVFDHVNRENCNLKYKWWDEMQKVNKLDEKLRQANQRVGELEAQKALWDATLRDSTAENDKLNTTITTLTNDNNKLKSIVREQELDAAVWSALCDVKEAEGNALKVAVEFGVLDKERMDEARAEVEMAQEALAKAEKALQQFEQEHRPL